MSFELPRPARGLRFTGEVRAAALGHARPKSNARPKPSGRPKPRSGPDVYQQEPAPTPYIGARPSLRAEIAAAVRDTPMRRPFDSLDDLAETRAMVREDLDLPPSMPRAAKPPRHAALGVPNFRRTAAPPEPAIVHLPPAAKKTTRSAGSPFMALMIWGVLALIGAMASYRYAPEILDDVKSAMKALDAR